MRQFFSLIDDLDSTTSTKEKTHQMAAYFAKCTPEDGAWALFFLSGQRFKRFLSLQKLRIWCQEEARIDHWLFTECLSRVGDSAEAISLLLPESTALANKDETLSEWLKENILPLSKLSEEEQKKLILKTWRSQTSFENFVTNKIISGTFRIGVSLLLTVKALSQAFDLAESLVHLRLAGNWEPTALFFKELTSSEANEGTQSLRPYPFYLASPLDRDLKELGEPAEWIAEWKWDGIRAQLISQDGQKAIWSRGNELITSSFPELFNEDVLQQSFVLDGEILVFENEKPRPFADLQKRLGRKQVSPTVMKQYPVYFMIYDLLQWGKEDIRNMTYSERRNLIEVNKNFFLKMPFWRMSPIIELTNWQEVIDLRLQSHQNMTEGLILKKKDSNYGTGRKRGAWWKYKVDSMTIDAVLIYAQLGSGYRSGLYTDYTFGVWNEKMELVPIAKAYSGLTQKEIAQVDKWIRAHTTEKFGPVRQVTPELVFEIAFENIQISKRHKSGLALRFPRIQRFRTDKTSDMANSLEDVHQLLKTKNL